MPAVKLPCLQCKEKHVKCDEERPKCRRCQLKKLPCSRPVKKTVFKHGSVASFSKDQKWVNSEARHFRFHARGGSAAREPLTPDQGPSPPWSTIVGPGVVSSEGRPLDETQPTQPSPSHSSTSSPMDTDLRPILAEASDFFPNLMTSGSFSSDQGLRLKQPESPSTQAPYLPSITQLNPGIYGNGNGNQRGSSVAQALSQGSPTTQTSSIPCMSASDDTRRVFPLEDVQEACLLRYYIEEISHWFDLCDESRHFHLIVPTRARDHPHLLNAIFAVAARHLSRLPQYKTPQGILYHGQLLPNLDEHSAVEYMLHCMPALRQFHDVMDDDYRDSIVATAVILRQLEEIDNEDDSPSPSGQPRSLLSGSGKQVNFLAIIDAVLRSPPSQSVFGRRSLMQAAYWMALRQEIYHSFTRLEAPQLILPPEFWHSASRANKTVMHLVQVAKWKWGDGSEHEWARLMDQHEHLEKHILFDIEPIYKKPADKSKGEIFPTVWYRSNIEVTSMQLGLLAKSVLVAENPQLRAQATSRSSWRHVENEVRLLLLEQCGIGLCNPASPPALVHATFGIQLYGDFFTDQYERRAIRMVVEKYRDTHAWPVQRLLDMFR
ncbi:ARCA-like protein [Metarhizium brunneum]